MTAADRKAGRSLKANESDEVDEVGRTLVQGFGIVSISILLLLVFAALFYSLLVLWPPAAATTQAVQPLEYSARFVLWDLTLTRDTGLFLIVLIAGAIGGSIHSLKSLYWYVGNRTLRTSWLLMYLSLPVVAAALSLMTYMLLRGGLTTTAASADLNPYGMAAIGALVGLFSREAITKLQAVFQTLLTTAEKGKDPADPVSILQFAPPSRHPGEEITITGTGLSAVSLVRFIGAEEKPLKISDTVITVKVPDGAQTGPIVVVTPDGSASSTTDLEVVPAAQVNDATTGGTGASQSSKPVNSIPELPPHP